MLTPNPCRRVGVHETSFKQVRLVTGSAVVFEGRLMARPSVAQHPHRRGDCSLSIEGGADRAPVETAAIAREGAALLAVPDDVATTDLPLTGGWNCGAVRYEMSAPLVAASYSHCRRCQRRSGRRASEVSKERDHRMARLHARVEGLLPRWALIEAAPHAARHPAYRDRYQRTATRLGTQRGKRSRASRSPAQLQPPNRSSHQATNRTPRQPAPLHGDTLA